MRDDERSRFVEALRAVFEVYGRDLSGQAVELWCRMMAPYPLDAVQRALQSHLQSSVYVPKPADVIGLLQARDGRPDADEAWEIALQAMDEDATVVWTEEIAQAKSAADPIWAEGDKVGARMAFRARYERLVADARQNGRAAKWSPSLGSDKNRRAEGIQRAVDMGRIPAERARKLLPDLAGNDSIGADLLPRLPDTGA